MKTDEIYLQAKDIALSLANTPQLTFEVTDACNLCCTYCGYGKFYFDYDTRENKRLSPEKAIALLGWLSKLWNSSLNRSAGQNIYISFYGGEPLLNMSFIQAIAQKYNHYYAKLDKQCKVCYNRKACIQCIYNLPDIDKAKVLCHGFMSKSDFEAYQNNQMAFLANNPGTYQRIMTEVIVK
jgi:hypothetical protein